MSRTTQRARAWTGSPSSVEQLPIPTWPITAHTSQWQDVHTLEEQIPMGSYVLLTHTFLHSQWGRGTNPEAFRCKVGSDRDSLCMPTGRVRG